jgi:hypothetical protein
VNLELETQIELGTVLVILAILCLGLFAHHRHERTRRQLKDLHRDLTGSMESLHDRADREGAERNWMLQGIRSSLEMLRVQVVALFRRDK